MDNERRRYKHHGAKIVPLSYLVFGVLTPVTHSRKHRAFIFSTSFSPLLHLVKTAFGISYSSVPAALLYKSVICGICTSPQFHYFAVRKVVSPAGPTQCIFAETNVSRLFLCTNSLTFRWCWTSTCLTNSHSLRLEYIIYNSIVFWNLQFWQSKSFILYRTCIIMLKITAGK